MKNEFEDVMSKRTDAELLQIINSGPGDYQPLALEAANVEFQKRNLSDEQMSVVNNEIEQKIELNIARSNEPLGVVPKIFASLFPGLVMVMFAGTYKADGYDRKAKEMVRWTIYGVLFYIAFVFLMLIITLF
ncbi:MAG TPA: hypothetical protein VHE59_02105 [Mucilaginibacter sp.]|nr:hypothetical protein [Mucilaginibacter sp.]